VHSCVYCLRQVDLLLRRLVQIGILSGCSTGLNKQVLRDDGSILLVDSYGRARGMHFYSVFGSWGIKRLIEGGFVTPSLSSKLRCAEFRACYYKSISCRLLVERIYKKKVLAYLYW